MVCKKNSVRIFIHDSNLFLQRGLFSFIKDTASEIVPGCQLIVTDSPGDSDWIFISQDDCESFVKCPFRGGTGQKVKVCTYIKNKRRNREGYLHEIGRSDSLQCTRDYIEYCLKNLLSQKFVSSSVCTRCPRHVLTVTEKAVLKLLASDVRAVYVSRAMGITIKTVSHHQLRIIDKLGFRNRYFLHRWISSVEPSELNHFIYLDYWPIKS